MQNILLSCFFSLRQFKHPGKLADFSRNYSSGGDKNHT